MKILAVGLLGQQCLNTVYDAVIINSHKDPSDNFPFRFFLIQV